MTISKHIHPWHSFFYTISWIFQLFENLIKQNAERDIQAPPSSRLSLSRHSFPCKCPFIGLPTWHLLPRTLPTLKYHFLLLSPGRCPITTTSHPRYSAQLVRPYITCKPLSLPNSAFYCQTWIFACSPFHVQFFSMTQLTTYLFCANNIVYAEHLLSSESLEFGSGPGMGAYVTSPPKKP